MSIILLKYISIFGLSLLIGSVLSKFIFSQKQYEKKKKFLLYSIIPTILGILMSILMLIIDKNTDKPNHNIDKIIENIKIKEKQNELLIEYQKEQEIINILQEFYNANYERNIERIDSFLVFPMDKYYTFRNVPKEKVNERIRFHFNHHNEPLFKVNLQNTEINFKTSDSIFVSILMIETNTKSVYTKIKMNNRKKIFSIGNTIMTNYYPDDDLDKKKSKIIKKK